MSCAIMDQQRLRTIVEIDENDSYTTNSSSSCFTSPSVGSPPVVRHFQTLSTVPRVYDLWNPGVYSSLSFDTGVTDSVNSPLSQKLTLNSDSGRESVDSSFSSENELSPPIKSRTTRPLTIYQIKRAKEHEFVRKSSDKSRCAFTSSTKVFIDKDEARPTKVEHQSKSPTAVLKIYIPPNVEKNVMERIAKHQQQNQQVPQVKPLQMDVKPARTNNYERITTPRYGVNSRDYRVSPWETSSEPGRIEDFMPEVDRWHSADKEASVPDRDEEAIRNAVLTRIKSVLAVNFNNQQQSTKPADSSLSSGASSSLPSSVLVKIDPDKLQCAEEKEAGDTLSDVSSSYAYDEQTRASKSGSVKSLTSTSSIDVEKITADEFNSQYQLSRSASKSSSSLISSVSNRKPIDQRDQLNSDSSLASAGKATRIRETINFMLQDRVVEVGVQPWKSESVKQFGVKHRPNLKLVEEKTKKRVLFSDEPSIEAQHFYENIDDYREQEVKHPRKILPMPGKRLPFRQPARVPVLSIPKHEPFITESAKLQDVGPEISFVSYRFYDKDMREQNSLSQRCSAQLLRKSAIRLSLPRSYSKVNSDVLNRAIVPQSQPQPQQTFKSSATAPLRYHLTSQNYSNSGRDDDPIVTVNGKQTCANCHLQLGRGQAMTIDSLGLFYHLHCFRCAQCGVLLNNGDSKGVDVRVCGSQIECNQCYNFNSFGLRYSQI